MGIEDGEDSGRKGSPTPEITSSVEQDVQGTPPSGTRRPAAPSSEATIYSRSSSPGREKRPPLPSRPTNLSLLQDSAQVPRASPQTQRSAPRPQLVSTATTALSRTDINTHSFQDGSRETFAATARTPPRGKSPRDYGSIRKDKAKGLSGSEGGETTSVRSYAATLEAGGDAESLLGDILGGGGGGVGEQEVPAWKLFSSQAEGPDPFEGLSFGDDEETADFYREFDEIPDVGSDAEREEELLAQWKRKRKHFLILSSAGKPIYSRHGNDNLISATMGTIQTIISFYEGAKDQLRSFTSGKTRFVIMSQGPLYLVAISKLGENDTQLRVQLEALYMQILSTLTLPNLTTIFSNRPNTDLRRPLKGTEVLLSALADSFTRGSPPALLSALECLKMKKTQRKVIDDTLLRTRSPELLYGLIVAGGRLVSVVRPRKHSLHAGDLQLIFNMLFEADGIKAGGGENWIPLCLPGFNKNGYLYMYVSFVPVSEDPAGSSSSSTTEPQDSESHNNNSSSSSSSSSSIAILLISANKESFDSLRTQRDSIQTTLSQNGSLSTIRTALNSSSDSSSDSNTTTTTTDGRPTITSFLPGTPLRHFLYKSRANVQFVMPSYSPTYTTLLARRRLLCIYHSLHASVHAKNAHVKVQHSISRGGAVGLAWVTPLFELYCVAGGNASRNAVAQSANQVVQWARREEERVFIIGGAVF